MKLNSEHLESFIDVYKEAKEIYNDEESAKHAPINPVVRFENRGSLAYTDDGFCWLIDSGLHSNEDTVWMCDLDDFINFFFQVGEDDWSEPTFDDMEDFVKMMGAE